MGRYNATITSVWDGGFEVSARCYVSKRKHLITRIGKNDVSDSIEEGLDVLEREYVTLDNGEIYKAVPKDEMESYDEEIVRY